MIIPCLNEEQGIERVMTRMPEFVDQVIVVDNGSTDRTSEVALSLGAQVIREDVRGYGRSYKTGFSSACGDIIVTLDGDGQNDPADIPMLLGKLRGDRSLGMVSGVRVKRQDSASRRIASKLANRFRNAMLGDGATDTGCGIKAFYRAAFLELPYFDHMHRYLIALVQRHGWKVGFAPVNHRPRLAGRSKYTNLGRTLVSFHDMLGVRWLQRRHGGRTKIEEL